MLVSGSKDSTVKLWDLATNKLKVDMPGHADEVYSVDWSPDGQVCCPSKPNTISSLTYLTACCQWLKRSHDKSVCCRRKRKERYYNDMVSNFFFFFFFPLQMETLKKLRKQCLINLRVNLD